MDNKAILDKLAATLNRDKKDINKLLEALSNVIKERCSEGDSIAIPQFGTFKTHMHTEHVDVDPETGKRTLFPPQVEMEFAPSKVLIKKLSNNGSKKA